MSIARSPYDSANVAIAGGRIFRMERGAAQPSYSIGDARLSEASNISGQAYSVTGANVFCVIPTILKNYQGLPGTAGTGAIVEPSMLYFPQGWNGWEFWMTAMPYDGSNAQYENPCIYCSHDGKNWTVPTGASNPLVLPPDGTNHNYDSTLFMLADGITMGIVYGQTANPNSSYYYLTSSDGVTWSAPVAMSGTSFAQATHYLNTPCPFYDQAAGLWTMYSCDSPGGSGGQFVYQTAMSLAGPWSALVSVTSNFPAGETAVYHADLKMLPGNEIVGLAMCGSSAGGRVYPVRIPPVGTGFGTVAHYGAALRPSNLLTSATYLYRSSMVAIGDKWRAIFGTLGLGPNSFAFIPGVIEFDSSVFFEALYARNGALMPAAQLTGTLAAVAPYSGGLFWDSFNHVTLGNCTASGNGSATAWTTGGTGTLAIVSNKLMQTVSGNSHLYANTASADVDMQIIIATLGSGFFATFRLQDTSNFWRISVVSGLMLIQSIASGSATGIAGAIVTTSEANSVLRVVAKGNSIRVFWQNLLVFDLNSAYLNTQTNHGVQISTDLTCAVANVLMALPR